MNIAVPIIAAALLLAYALSPFGAKLRPAQAALAGIAILIAMIAWFPPGKLSILGSSYEAEEARLGDQRGEVIAVRPLEVGIMIVEPAHHRLDREPAMHRRPARIGQRLPLGHDHVIGKKGEAREEAELFGRTGGPAGRDAARDAQGLATARSAGGHGLEFPAKGAMLEGGEERAELVKVIVHLFALPP